VLPPRLAPTQVGVVPIWKKDAERAQVSEALQKVESALHGKVSFAIDRREEFSPGWKFNDMELKGIPLRLELGPRDVAAGQAMSVTRIDRTKEAIPLDRLAERVPEILDSIQAELLRRNQELHRDNTRPVDTYDSFKERIDADGGFLQCHWCGSGKCEAKVKEDTKATIRCIPLDAPEESGECLICGKASSRRVLFARAY